MRRIDGQAGEDSAPASRTPGVPAPPAFRQQLLDALPRLRRYARSLCFDASRADDLVQGTLERALTHWHQFDPLRPMPLWLLSIAHNAHLDGLRRERRQADLDPDALAQALDRQPVHEDPGLRIDLLAALQRLSSDQREALLLVSVERLSYAEAAEVLQVPAGTVMSRVSRARVALRLLLDGGAQAGERGAASPHLRRVI